jgi:hypothetical protein
MASGANACFSEESLGAPTVTTKLAAKIHTEALAKHNIRCWMAVEWGSILVLGRYPPGNPLSSRASI